MKKFQCRQLISEPLQLDMDILDHMHSLLQIATHPRAQPTPALQKLSGMVESVSNRRTNADL